MTYISVALMTLMMSMIDDFDVFSPEHSQYLAFSFDGGGLDGHDIPFARFSTYIFFYSVRVLTFATEAYD